jgi:type II secretory pathway pseudopilin PulG
MNSSRRSGTSLVEVLVVIVVFLVGILAIVQIFPGGFKALSYTQKSATANTLARAEIEMVKNHADQMPDAIAPVSYLWNGSQIVISLQPDRFPGDLGPAYSNLGPDGTMYDGGGNAIGNWQFLTGANIGRRVLGEGKVIPTPRLVGSQYGSLLSLDFAPVIYNPIYRSLFVVYGNDLTRRQGDPTVNGNRIRPTEYYVDNEDTSSATLFLPHDAVKTLSYRIDFTAYDNTGKRVDVVDFVHPVAPADSPNYDFNNMLGGVQSVDYDSIRVSRAFDQVPNSGSFTSDPYEYVLLSQQLGQVLFNPVGYNYFIRRPGGRRDPLVGRVSYDVYDWRVIHDEFRAPDMYPASYRLALGGLKVAGETGADGRANAGIGVQSPDSTGAMLNADFVLEDADTGGLYCFAEGTQNPHLTSYTINKSIGLVNFLDYDSDPTNGIQMMLLAPGAATPTVVTVTGRALRGLYMGKNDWAVQVLKPSARYTETWGRPGIGQYYIGASDGAYGQDPHRVYFAPADAGRQVSLGEIYYDNSAGITVGPIQLTAKLQTNNMDSENLPYIDMRDYFPDFANFNYTYGTAIKSVKGASVAARVLWNPDAFRLDTDPAVNIDRLTLWMQSWRRSTVETYLQRGY